MVGMFGRGWLGSIERRVRHEIKVHARENAAIRRARYSWLQQMLRMAVARRTLTWFLTAYLFVAVAAVVAEAFFYSSIHCSSGRYSWNRGGGRRYRHPNFGTQYGHSAVLRRIARL